MDDEFKPKKGYFYEKSESVEKLVQHMKDIGMFPNLDLSKMAFINSKKIPKKKEKKYSNDKAGEMEKELDELKAKRKYIARCHTTHRFWKDIGIYGDKLIYFVIETADECYTNLSDGDKIRVIIHELYHIPPDFSIGGLMQHNEFSCINTLYNKYIELNKNNDEYKLEQVKI